MAASNLMQEKKKHIIFVALASNHCDLDIVRSGRSFMLKVRNELKATSTDV